MANLNNITIKYDHYNNIDSSAVRGTKQSDNTSVGNVISVYLKNQMNHLIKHIQKAEVVIGCVAWLTHTQILNALANVPNGCKIVVQKEDFLRPDTHIKNNSYKKQLRDQYDKIKAFEYYTGCGMTTKTIVDEMNTATIPGDCECAIRCCGNHNEDNNPAFPRMHNKFLLFCKIKRNDDCYNDLEPYGVWTGSLNLTHNSVNSLENGLYITDERIVKAYTNEWGNIMAISEQLDWTSQWAAPDMRLGT